nr:MAG TPA: C2H2 type zinc-finger protein [Caudoviricetes sp.]
MFVKSYCCNFCNATVYRSSSWQRLRETQTQRDLRSF